MNQDDHEIVYRLASDSNPNGAVIRYRGPKHDKSDGSSAIHLKPPGKSGITEIVDATQYLDRFVQSGILKRFVRIGGRNGREKPWPLDLQLSDVMALFRAAQVIVEGIKDVVDIVKDALDGDDDKPKGKKRREREEEEGEKEPVVTPAATTPISPPASTEPTPTENAPVEEDKAPAPVSKPSGPAKK